MTALSSTPPYRWNWVVRLGFCLGILVLLLLLAIRLLLPQLTAYRAELEAAVGDYLGLPIQLERVTASWQGWEPVLRIQGFNLHDPDSGLPLVSFQNAWARLDLPRSLINGRLVARHIRLQGGRLSLTRDAQNRLGIASQSPGGNAPSLESVAAWLFPVGSLDITLSELSLPISAANPELFFRDVRLSLRGRAGQQRLGLSMELPEALGQRLSLALTMDADNNDPADWQGVVYARAEGVQLAGWPLSLTLPATGQISSLELWGDWQAFKLTRFHGRADLQDITPAGATHAVQAWLPRLDQLSTTFNWQATERGWQFRSHWQGTNTAGLTTIDSPIDLHYAMPAAGQPGQLQGNASQLRLQDLTALIKPWLNDQQRLWLARLNPSGKLPALTWRIPFDELQSLDGYSVTAHFRDLTTQPWEHLPAIADLAGHITLAGNEGRLQLDTQHFELSAAALDEPFIGDRLHGAIDWRQQTDDRLQVETTGLEIAAPGLTATLHGSATLATDRVSPYWDVMLDYTLEDLSRIKVYLPRKLMKPRLVKWLDRALIGGRVDKGQLKIQGHLADFPFADGQGLFEARQRVHDGIADYAPGWPRIENLAAEIVFRNRTFQMQASAGTLLDAELEQGTARINDLGKAIVEIDGLARGPATTLLTALRDSPLAKKIGPYIAGMQASGNNTLALNLSVPLDRSPIHAQGTIGFTGNSVKLLDQGVFLSQVHGDLHFTDRNLTARDVRLVLRGEPARLDIDTLENPDKPAINFTLQGRWGSATLANNDRLKPYIVGKTPWKLVLNVLTTGVSKRPDFALELSSDLAGATVELPTPLGKNAEEKRDFKLTVRRRDAGNMEIQLNYAPDTQAVLEWADWPQQPRFHRGALRIGDLSPDSVQLPEDPGLVVTAHLPRWQLTAPTSTETNTGFPDWLTRLNARFDELLIGDWRIPNLTLEALPQDDHTALLLDSATLAGRLSLPKQGSAEPVQGVLERLVLEPRSQTVAPRSAKADGFDPRSLPPLAISVQDLRWEDRTLGRLKIATQSQPEGLRLTDLYLQSPHHELTATGNWLMTDQGPLSRIQAGLNSKGLGETLRSLGYTTDLEGGETHAELTASWRGALTDFSPTRLEGYLDFDIDSGQLVNVDPGMGRIFSLLNLNNITRRLRLDFSDLFEKGLSFDRIQGGFTFAEGQAYTDDFNLQGPTADIAIQGKVDLIKRRYDQVIAVTPHVGTPLTIAGTIAGGPVVGAAAFLAEQLLKPGIDQVARYYYTLTGSWEAPIIEPIDKPVTADKPAAEPAK
ncbi:MAG: YhdP family protein [Candidatus Competibacteraceae bacterium]|jgi:uncharacterized protein (TIGR02099 family)|nr:YhdP family protein [Candidatus Competibacteraceae bacterium]